MNSGCPDSGGEQSDPQLPLDIPLSLAPRETHVLQARSTPHALLVRAQSRLLWAGGFFAVAFLLVALRLVDAMVLAQVGGARAAYLYSGDVEVALPGLRADITDRNGELLATSLPAKSLYADPKMVLDPVAAAKAVVSVLPELDYEAVLDKLNTSRRFVWLKRNLTPEEVFEVNALGQPGLDFQDEFLRIYPAGASLAHVVGVTDVDGVGLGGVERGLNERLLKDVTSPLVLSIDLRVQHILERELKAGIDAFAALGGAGVVMDVLTGEVLAAVSLPTFVPAHVGSADEQKRFNRFSHGVYELGSIMKVLNTAAALESGKIRLGDFFDAEEPIRYGRHLIRDFHPEKRKLSVEEVFLHSSNIGSARMAQKMGKDFQRDFFCRVGLCSSLDIEILEVGEPDISSEWKELKSMTASYGHGLAITPLHYMQAAAATINGGHLVRPTFLKREGDSDLPRGPVVLKPSTVEAMRRVLRANVANEDGGGGKADVPGYFVGGKTGTAEKTQGRRYSRDAKISSFVGVFPMHRPRYMVFVMVDEPKPNKSSFGYATGGWVAAPVVRHVIAQMGPLLGMVPEREHAAAIEKALHLTIHSLKPRETEQKGSSR